jgi:poly-gamma-glutamate synthesis protein (capsule biosynthesis protein)
MKKLTLFTILQCFLAATLFAGYTAKISPITPKIEHRMRAGHSYRDGCPVKLRDLRYLKLQYLGFDGKPHIGEMIVHKDVAKEVTQIFRELYRAKYPIRRMRLVSDYGGSDYCSIEADNTSAFNCRPVTGGKRWSNHAYGRAIDLNPIENPYISRSGRIAHKASLPYRVRRHKNPFRPQDQALIAPHAPIVRIFKSRGWRWGGEWHSVKDYQHFDKNRR